MYRKLMNNVLMWLFLCLGVFEAQAAEVKDVRVAQQSGVTRLVFELSDSMEHRLFPLSNPDRVVLDVSGATLSESAIKSLDELPGGVLERVRHARQDSGTRFVLDLKRKVRSKSTVLAANDTYGPRILVELDYSSGSEKVVPVKTLASIANEKRDVVVVIDAGHGGKDPGALGKYNVREKDVVLSIAVELAKQLKRIDGFKPVLTRDRDVFLKLRDRSKIAREANADLMISIHADAFTNPKARGASVWALSLGGKTSEMGRWLAQQEQSSDLVGGISLGDKDQLLAEVLLDMSMNSTIQFSLDIGSQVLGRMDRITKLHKTDVQQAGFVVLKSPDIPSILIETGFVSNPTEAKNLSSSQYRKKLAEEIATGVVAYFNANPPEGSLLAWKKQRKAGYTYVVAKGDTLSEIARRNQVSLGSLRQVNALKSDVIWVGQKLVIPPG